MVKGGIKYIALTIAGLLIFAPDIFGFNTTSQKPTSMQIQNAMTRIKNTYGSQVAKWVEQIYRLETANFTSKQYLDTFSAGMWRMGNDYPYGWSTPAKLWAREPLTAPIGFARFTDAGAVRDFLKFRDVYSGMASLAEYLNKYQDPGRWNSTDPTRAAAYVDKLSKITTQYV